MQLVYWGRMHMVAVTNGAKDRDLTEERLMRLPVRIGNSLADGDAARKICQMFAALIQIGTEITHALALGKNVQADSLSREFYKSCDETAEHLARLKDGYNKEEIRRMLYSHGDLAKHQTHCRISCNHHAELDCFERLESEMQTLADYLIHA
jgi:hypothetical protein